MDGSAATTPLEDVSSSKKLAEKWTAMRPHLDDLGHLATKAEKDFAYEYAYNRELIEEGNVLRAELKQTEENLSIRTFEMEVLKEDRKRVGKEALEAMERLKKDLAAANKPSHFWRRVALSSLLVLILVASAWSYEKYVGPLDSLREMITIKVSELTKQTSYRKS